MIDNGRIPNPLSAASHTQTHPHSRTTMASIHTISCSLPGMLQSLSLGRPSTAAASISVAYRPLGFSSATSLNLFSKGFVTRPVQAPLRLSIVCEATSTKKPDQAAKRVRQAEKRRMRNKSRKSEVKTRMKKVLKALELLRKKPEAEPEEILPIEKLIGEAYSVIDKAVRKGILHRNTGARRKSRLARRKKTIEIKRGWYTPAPADEAPTPVAA